VIESLFPEGVIGVAATPEMWAESLPPEEEAAIVRAVTRRRREFTAGRACARQALASLGFPVKALPMGPDRLPSWPAGVVGSISHCQDFCAAAVARRDAFESLGLDVERAVPLDDHLVSIVCQDDELAGASLLPGPHARLTSMLVFSAKESAFKCWFPVGRTFLDFHDVRIAFDPARSAFTAKFVHTAGVPERLREMQGRYVIEGPHLGTGVPLRAR